MARTNASLGSGARLTDEVSPSLLARVYPAPLIGELVDAHHGTRRRQRSFSATAVAYGCLALSLYPEAVYADGCDAVAQGLAWRNRGLLPLRLKAASIRVARSRLSWPVFKRLQEVACRPLAGARTGPRPSTAV